MVFCTMRLTLGHGAWQIDQPSNGSMWNSYSFQPVGQWIYSFTDLGAEGCCRFFNALFYSQSEGQNRAVCHTLAVVWQAMPWRFVWMYQQMHALAMWQSKEQQIHPELQLLVEYLGARRLQHVIVFSVLTFQWLASCFCLHETWMVDKLLIPLRALAVGRDYVDWWAGQWHRHILLQDPWRSPTLRCFLLVPKVTTSLESDLDIFQESKICTTRPSNGYFNRLDKATIHFNLSCRYTWHGWPSILHCR